MKAMFTYEVRLPRRSRYSIPPPNGMALELFRGRLSDSDMNRVSSLGTRTGCGAMRAFAPLVQRPRRARGLNAVMSSTNGAHGTSSPKRSTASATSA